MRFAQQSHYFCRHHRTPPLSPVPSIIAPTTRALGWLINMSAVLHMLELAQGPEICFSQMQFTITLQIWPWQNAPSSFPAFPLIEICS